MTEKKVNRREYIKYAGAAVGGLIVGGVVGYLSKPVGVVEKTVEKTVTAPAAVSTVTVPGVEKTVTAPAKPAESISVYMVAEPAPEATKKILDLCKKKTGIDVTLEVYPYPTLQTKQATVLSAGSATPDVVMVDDVWLGQYYESGWIDPIDDLVERDKTEINFDDFIPGIVEGNMKYRGKLLGLAHLSAIYIFYYRTDIFEEFGYSEKDLDTYDGVYEVAKAMKPDLEKRGMYPIGFMGARGVQATCCYYHFLGTFGGRVYDPETFKPEINSPEAVEALEFEAKLAKEVGIPSIPADDYGELQANFLNSRIAMFPAWHNMAPVLLLPESPVRGKWRGIPVPKKVRRAPTLGGWCLSINKFSKKKDAAWEFIKWATGTDISVYCAKYQDMSRYSAFADPSKACYAMGSTTDLEIAWPRPNIPPWPAMSDLIGIAVNRVLAGETTAKAACDDLQAKFVEILRSAGYYKG